MDEEQGAQSTVVPIEFARYMDRKSTPIEPEHCQQCRIRMKRLTEYIYLAADLIDESHAR